jgi:hypothetical protein
VGNLLNPYLYPLKPAPVAVGTGFCGYGLGLLLNDPGVSLGLRTVTVLTGHTVVFDGCRCHTINDSTWLFHSHQWYGMSPVFGHQKTAVNSKLRFLRVSVLQSWQLVVMAVDFAIGVHAPLLSCGCGQVVAVGVVVWVAAIPWLSSSLWLAVSYEETEKPGWPNACNGRGVAVL